MITLMPIKNINNVLQALKFAHIDEVATDEVSVNAKVYDNAHKYVFIKDGEQIGYIAYIIARHSHYDKMVLQDISYFIRKESRAYARTIFKLVEKQAKKQGCDMSILHCKTEKQLRFFKILGYKLSDYIIRKDL